MQIVIDIPKEDWEFIKESDGCRWSRAIIEGVINGTPLPKGHGDLIDRNDLLEYTDINRSAYIPIINRYEIITAPTIIEADKAESEGKNADNN